jgi:hypothetical protein
MPYSSRSEKPVFDAVTDAMAAVGDLVRSLRQTAKSAGRDAKSAARDAKQGIAGAAARAGNGVHHAEDGLKTRLERAWGVLAHGDGMPAASPIRKGSGKKRRRKAKAAKV